jgi:hypothetical protein
MKGPRKSFEHGTLVREEMFGDLDQNGWRAKKPQPMRQGKAPYFSANERAIVGVEM